MNLVDIKCPNCGASIQLDNSRKSGFCSYCGLEIQIQEVINKIKIDRSGDIENYLSIGNAAAEMGNGQEACDYANKVLELNPNNAEAWKLKMVGIGCMPGFHCHEIITAGNKALKLNDSFEFKKEIYILFLSLYQLYLQDACEMLLQDLQTLKVLYDSNYSLDPDNAANNMINEDITKDYLINEIQQMLDLRFAVPNEEIEKNEDLAKITVEIAKGWIACEQALNKRYNIYGAYISTTALDYWNNELEKIKQGLPSKYLTDEINNCNLKITKTIKTVTPTNQQTEKKNEGCYIATAVYGSYDTPEVMILRQFRDNTLNSTYFGKWFIRTYYRLSPPIAEKLKDAKYINKLVRFILDTWIKHLQLTNKK